MIRRFKAVGVVMVAGLVMGAVLASAAQATNFTASKYPTAATASSSKGNDEWKTEAGTIECQSHFHVSSLSESSEALTISPTFSECAAFGFLNMATHTNGCTWVFYTSGTMDIKCPAGNQMVGTAATCEHTVGSQTTLSKIDFANSGTGFTAQMTVTGINYTVTKDGFGCPFLGTGAKTGASYTQNSAIQFSSTNGANIDIG